MKKIILTSLLMLSVVRPGYGGSLTLSTYYPAPLGAYDRLRLVPRAAIGGTSCDLGTLYVNANDNNSIYFCKDDGVDGAWTALGGNVWTQSGNDIYLTDTSSPENKKIGIGTNTPEFKLTLDNDGGIISTGPAAYGTGTLLSTAGAGTRFIWYRRKAAIRAGEVTGAQWDNANIGNFSAAFGKNTLAGRYFNTVSGGEKNSVGIALENQFSTIGGGLNNSITKYKYGVIAGGQGNSTGGAYSFIGGGINNSIADHGDSTSIIAGGDSNALSSSYNAIGGGGNNIIQSGSAIIAGGQGNSITINGNASTISGGKQNNCVFTGDTVGGGLRNASGSFASTVSGGTKNKAGGNYTTVTGGISNIIAYQGDQGTIIGGEGNNVRQFYSVIAGGRNNLADDRYTFIGGGDNNQVVWQNKPYKTIVGGLNNTTEGAGAFIGGGSDNISNGYSSVVSGGRDNQAVGYTWAGGRHMVSSSTNVFLWGYSGTDVVITQAGSFIIYSGNVGIGTTTPAEKLHVNGNVRVKTGTITISSPPAVTGSPLEIDGGGAVGLDIAEIFKSTEEVEVGDLLVIDETQKIKLKKSRTPYDKKVVGVVSGAPAMLFKGQQLAIAPQPYEFTKGTNPPVALSGRVPVKVSLENGPIEVGDLLTSSSIPGHAMKASDEDKSFGTIVGKAIQPFTGGPNKETTGTIIIFVTLR